MNYSYNPALIGAGGRDQMRFELGDTLTHGGAETCALSDEEYDTILGGLKAPENMSRKSWMSAKLYALEAILFKLSYQPDMSIDVLSYSFGGRADIWRDLYESTRKQIEVSQGGLPSAVTGNGYFYTGMDGNPRSVTLR